MRDSVDAWLFLTITLINPFLVGAMVQGQKPSHTPAATPREVLKVSPGVRPQGEIKTSAQKLELKQSIGYNKAKYTGAAWRDS